MLNLPKIEGFPLLGYAIHWHIPNFQISAVEFRDMFLKAGLPEKLVRDIDPKNAATRAVRDVAKSLGKVRGKKSMDFFHRKVADNDAEAAWVIVESDIDATDYDVDFSTGTKVVFDKKTQNLRVQGVAADEIHDKFREYCHHYTGAQFATLALKYLYEHCKGCSIRSRGGIYFVSGEFKKEFEKLEYLFQSMGALDCYVTALPLVNTAQARKGMWRSFITEIEGDIRDFRDDLNKCGEMREHMIERRMTRYNDVRQKVEMYSTLLEGKANDLLGQLRGLGKDLQAKLTE